MRLTEYRKRHNKYTNT